MQAIVTKYHGPTNARGSRISAKADAGRITVSYEYFPGGNGDSHAHAVAALCRKLGWAGELVSGGMPDNTGNCYVFTRRMHENVSTIVIDGVDWTSGKPVNVSK